MKLVRKLSLAISLGICVVLGVRTRMRAAEERADFREDVRRDHEQLGKSLARSVEVLWSREGPTRAIDLIDRLNQPGSSLRMRFVRPSAEQGAHDYALSPREIPRVGQPVHSRLLLPDASPPTMLSYVPIDLPEGSDGGIELYEELTDEDETISRFVARTVVTTAVVLAVCAAIVFLFGVVFVARPLRKLVNKAERIGRGDLSGPLVIDENNEIRDLALAMNDMCRRLEEARDLAEREATARVRTLDQLRHADRLRTVGELASGIAHQLGTPLNVVRGRGRMIAAGEVSEARMRELGDIIVEQVDRMGDSIRALLDFARRQQPTLSACDVGNVLQQSLRLVEPLASERNVDVQLTLPEDSIVLPLDAGQIHQALTNLLVNALHASPFGGVVEVKAERTASEATISVRDFGDGIEAKQLEHIFEPFFTTKGVGEGTGLGLSVAQGIVREHRGRITVESARGQGAVFRVSLPLAREFSPGLPAQVPA
jgi:two-component system NtrC family sensor kinase